MENLTYLFKQVLHYLMLLTLFLVTFCIFYLFKPFDYIDSSNSAIKCTPGRTTSSGASIIFSYDGTLDKFNQIKAIKLCAYDIVFDYYNQFSTPDNIRYEHIVKIKQYSSWLQALFAILLILIIILPISRFLKIDLLQNLDEFYNKNRILSSIFLVVFISASFLFFQFAFKSKLQSIYCINILRVQLDEFKLATNLSGKEFPRIEYDWAKSQEKRFITKCLKYGYIYEKNNSNL